MKNKILGYSSLSLIASSIGILQSSSDLLLIFSFLVGLSGVAGYTYIICEHHNKWSRSKFNSNPSEPTESLKDDTVNTLVLWTLFTIGMMFGIPCVFKAREMNPYVVGACLSLGLAAWAGFSLFSIWRIACNEGKLPADKK